MLTERDLKGFGRFDSYTIRQNLKGCFMYFTVYETVCLVTGKSYIGKHKTKVIDDKYLGSGRDLIAAVRVFGKDNFVKKILFVFDKDWQMDVAERILVVRDSDISYNISCGGKGGWDYINKNNLVPAFAKALGGRATVVQHKGLFSSENFRRVGYCDPEIQARMCARAAGPASTKRRNATFVRIKHQQGLVNSQYGTRWITNGVLSRKIKCEDPVPLGWCKGRVQRKQE